MIEIPREKFRMGKKSGHWTRSNMGFEEARAPAMAPTAAPTAPARSPLESLSQLCHQTTTKLTALWSGDGLPEAEQTERIEKMGTEIRNLLSEWVSTEEAKLLQLREKVPELESELRGLSGVLDERGADIDPSWQLVPRHQSLLSEVERCRAMAAERTTQREECEAQHTTILDEIELPKEDDSARRASMANEPRATEPRGLSTALLERMRKRLSEVVSERASRIDQAAILSSDIERLRKDIGIPDAAPDEGSAPRTGSKYSTSALAEQEAKLIQLQTEAERRQNVLRECAAYIKDLELELKLEPHECTTLPQNGLHKEVLEAYNAELERLEKLKAESLAGLLIQARGRLQALWGQLHMCEAETRAFKPAWSPEVSTDDSTPPSEEVTVQTEKVSTGRGCGWFTCTGVGREASPREGLIRWLVMGGSPLKLSIA